MTGALAGYAIDRVLARGGHTVVFLQRDDAGHPVVLKTLAPGAPDDAVERLRAEGALLAAAQGPGVVALLATVPGVLVLEHAPGGSLAERLRAGPLPPAEARRVFLRVADAVARLHAAGIVHRDLKPANILFGAGGAPLLADFGVAARIGARGTLGDGWEELRVGTPPFAAPEQWSTPAASAHPSADVHALAVLHRELLGTTAEAALHPDPSRRPPSVAALLRALPHPPSPLRDPRLLAALALLVVLLLQVF